MWKVCLCSLLLCVKFCENVQVNNDMSFIPRRNVLNIISEFIDPPPSQSTVATAASDVPILSISSTMKSELEIRTGNSGIPEFDVDVDAAGIDVTDSSLLEMNDLTRPPLPPPSHRYPVQHASVPQGLAVVPLPLPGADHELVFNVTWQPGLGAPARDYSLEVRSIKDTVDCNTPMCYEYNIPGESRWWSVPALRHPVSDTCAVKPGCAYRVRLIAHPWDGHTSANLLVELDECVSGVCSCAHAARLPTPAVAAQVVTVEDEVFANITWSLPLPSNPLRLPRGLQKQFYFLSIGKQMVSDAHPSPWYAHTVSRQVTASGPVADGDTIHWFLLPLLDKKVGEKQKVVLNVKLLARVSLVDDRGCLSPAGNATAFDPNKSQPAPIATYALWSALGGACVLAMVAVVAVSSQVMKKALHALRSTPISDPHEPRSRNAWFPLHLHTNNELPSRGQVEQSPLYTHKEFEPPDELADKWEVRRSRIELGAMIGRGAFGRVHAATLAMPGGESLVVAAKMLSENATEDEMQDFLREISMLKHVGYHKHVIRLIGCCSTRAPLIVLLEHAPRGDLLSLLRAARGRRRDPQGSNVTRRADSGSVRPSEEESEYTNLSDSDPTLHEEKLYLDDYKGKNKDHYVAEPVLLLDGSTMREYALQVALGMSHLEERGITHRDLAARNILVDGAGVLKVADFGLSRCGVYVHTRARPVPLRWLAPEAILHSQYSSASDVWAFAVLLWEIATLGGFPYAELSNQQVPTFLTGGGRLPKPVRASPRLYEVMVQCWMEDSQRRPTFAQLVGKLQAQKQLYVDLDSVLSHDEEISDGDFSLNSAEWVNDR